MSFGELAGQPKMGAPVPVRDVSLTGLRRWSIKGFPNHLIFYLPQPDGVSIVRVLHASSDWWALLGMEPH